MLSKNLRRESAPGLRSALPFAAAATIFLAVGAAQPSARPAAIAPTAVTQPALQIEEIDFFDVEAKRRMRAEAPEFERQYLIDIGSRVINPSPNVVPRFVGQRAELIIQFTAPLTPEELGGFTRSGVRFFEPLGASTYWVRLKPEGLRALRSHRKWRGAELVQPEDKVTRELFRGHVGRHAITPDGRWLSYVHFHEDVILPRALAELAERNIQVPAPDRFLIRHALEVYLKPSDVRALIANPAVRRVRTVPRPPSDDNTQAAQLSNIDDVQAAPYNLSGAGVIFGQSEGGSPQTDHPDLTGRITLAQGANPGDHATHVAGTMIASGAGMAGTIGMGFAGQLVWYDNGGNVATEFVDGATMMGVVAHCNSWSRAAGWECGGGTCNNTGNTGDFGLYESECGDVDAAAILGQVTIGKSSGNAGGECDPNPPGACDGVAAADGNYDNIEIFSAAKNIITVGNLQDDGVTIRGSSSRGPADDGRIKPDLVANGQSLTSTCIGSTYCSKSGTSMSTPTTMGAAGLIVERWRQLYGNTPPPDVIKALLVNSAVDLGRPGPDYTFGHGLVDALAAIQLVDVADVHVLRDAVAQNGQREQLVIVPAGAPELRVTLNWLDLPGVPDSGDPDIIHDLDVALISPSGQVSFPFTGPGMAFTSNATANAANKIDTVEHASVMNPEQGFWTVRVTGFAVPMGPQPYALVSNIPFWVPDEPNITVSAALDFDELCEGEMQSRVVSIFNTGGAPLLVHNVSLASGAAGFTLLPNPIQPVFIHPGSHVDYYIQFDPAGPGFFMDSLEIFSNDPDMPNISLGMTGEGCPPPDIAVSGSTDFGQVCQGELAEKTIDICNVGVDVLQVSSASFIGCNDFVVVNSIFPAPVPSGHCLPLTVRYTPQTSGTHTCDLTILSNDPDENPFLVTFTATTPEVSLHVLAPEGFPPTVIQSVGNCASTMPLTITNTGACPIYVKDISISAPGPNFADFKLLNLSEQPTYLLPGETIGDGQLMLEFRPNQIERFVTGTLNVLYQTDQPMIGGETTVSFPLCGEGVATGARVVVIENGVPVPTVERIRLYRVFNPGPSQIVQSVDTTANVTPSTVLGSPPCPGFTFHREWGGLTNPGPLDPGSYLVEARVIINGVLEERKKTFEVSTCDFIPDIVLD